MTEKYYWRGAATLSIIPGKLKILPGELITDEALEILQKDKERFEQRKSEGLIVLDKNYSVSAQKEVLSKKEKKELKKLLSQNSDLEKKVEDLKNSLADKIEEKAEILLKLADSQKDLSEMTNERDEALKKLTDSQKDLSEMTNERDEALKKLADSQKDLSEMTNERDKILNLSAKKREIMDKNKIELPDKFMTPQKGKTISIGSRTYKRGDRIAPAVLARLEWENLSLDEWSENLLEKEREEVAAQESAENDEDTEGDIL